MLTNIFGGVRGVGTSPSSVGPVINLEYVKTQCSKFLLIHKAQYTYKYVDLVENEMAASLIISSQSNSCEESGTYIVVTYCK